MSNCGASSVEQYLRFDIPQELVLFVSGPLTERRRGIGTANR
jgi:hypothetical protein